MSAHTHFVSRRRTLTSFLAAFTAAAGFASTSCAAPRLPAGGYGLRSAAAGYEFQVLVDGAPVPTFEHAGETHVLGQLGARYTLRVVNHTGRRIEAVVSVDGRDAIDGNSADVRQKRGYLVPAWGSVDIDGWRLSRANVAAFRFSAVADSYAARTGNAREVGVIGVAVFPERYVAPRPVYAPPRQPYAPPPSWQPWRDDVQGLGAPSPRDSYARGAESEQKSGSPSPSTGAGAGLGATANKRSAATADAASPAPRAEAKGESDGFAPRRRSGLGTEFGEQMNSPVREVAFVRANAARPAVVLGARYNDRQGLLALGINVDGCCVGDDDLALRQSATPFPASDARYAAPPAGWQQGCCLRY